MTQRDNEIFDSLVKQLADDESFNRTARKFAGGAYARRMVMAVAIFTVGIVGLLVSLSALTAPFNVMASIASFGIMYAGAYCSPFFSKAKFVPSLDKTGKQVNQPKPKSQYMKNLEDRWEQRRSNNG